MSELILGWVDSEKWPDATYRRVVRHSEFSFFLNPGLGVQLYLLPRALPAASLQDFWIFSQEEDPAASSAG